MLLVKVSLLRPPSSASARSRAQLYATDDPRSPRHGLESPCHVARAFQPVGLGRALRPLPPSASPPSDLSVPSCQKSFRVFRVFRGPTLRCPFSVVRRPSSAVSRPIRFLRVLRLLAANPRSSPHPSRSAPEHSRGRNDSASSKTITPALAPSFAIHQSSCEGLRS